MKCLPRTRFRHAYVLAANEVVARPKLAGFAKSFRWKKPVADDPQRQQQISAMRATAPDVVGDGSVSPFEIENKSAPHAVSGNDIVQRAYCPRDMEVVDEFPERQEESAGIATGDTVLSEESANTLQFGFFHELARMPHGTLPHADEDSSFRNSGLTSPFHFQMAKIGG